CASSGPTKTTSRLRMDWRRRRERPVSERRRHVLASRALGARPVAVHPADEVDGHFLRANGLALAEVAAGAKALLLHALDHALDPELGAVAELAQVELADGGGAAGTVSDAVDHEAAGAADALAAVAVEGDGRLALGEQPLVEHVEHFEERHVLVGVADLVALEA